MSLLAAPLSSATRLPAQSAADPAHTRSTRRKLSTSSPTDPFENLDPSLHPVTLNSVTDENDLSPQTAAENRLNDFAQHVLEGHDDASNLLAFSAEDGGLFGSNPNSQFEALLGGSGEDQRVEGDGVDQGDYLPEGIDGEDGNKQDVIGETPGGRTRGGGRKRRREGEEVENGDTSDPVKVKKDSHVCLLDPALHVYADFHVQCRKKLSVGDVKPSTTGLVGSLVWFLAAWRRWAKELYSAELRSIWLF